MKEMFIEFLGPVGLYVGFGIKILTATILGLLIGYDREKKMKSAGLKTNMLICLGACMYTAVSLLSSEDVPTADPNRIAAQIVSGIGFLGAGAIIQSRGAVVGMTTAATIWLVAAIGITVGMGYPVVASLFTVTVLIVLTFIGPIYKLMERKGERKTVHLEILSKGGVKHSVKEVVLEEVDVIHEIFEKIIDHDSNQRLLNIYISLHPRRVTMLM
jgi:putative Mg2+ transporter-C (MgtC) family protein